ncbi:MAG TPA: hypothetical protein VEA35_13305 [Ramlibacter sp.]|nr:hypothetical protein [Ramlibacter sp.]
MEHSTRTVAWAASLRVWLVQMPPVGRTAAVEAGGRVEGEGGAAVTGGSTGVPPPAPGSGACGSGATMTGGIGEPPPGATGSGPPPGSGATTTGGGTASPVCSVICTWKTELAEPARLAPAPTPAVASTTARSMSIAVVNR